MSPCIGRLGAVQPKGMGLGKMLQASSSVTFGFTTVTIWTDSFEALGASPCCDVSFMASSIDLDVHC